MNRICENIEQIKNEIGNVQLVVVSKFRSLEELRTVYDCGHRDLAENRVQELLEKHEQLPEDIRWHLIGHLQTNKVKYIAEFVHMIHAVDSIKLLRKINAEAAKHHRVIPILLQVHIAQEAHKFGFSAEQVKAVLQSEEFNTMDHVRCEGLMGMATNTTDATIVSEEFSGLRKLADSLNLREVSMGMSGDYPLAVANGSTMVRIGSKVFN